jgi:hypothetical protein
MLWWSCLKAERFKNKNSMMWNLINNIKLNHKKFAFVIIEEYNLTFAVKALKKSASPYVVRPSGFMILLKVVADSGFFRVSQYFFYLSQSKVLAAKIHAECFVDHLCDLIGMVKDIPVFFKIAS